MTTEEEVTRRRLQIAAGELTVNATLFYLRFRDERLSEQPDTWDDFRKAAAYCLRLHAIEPNVDGFFVSSYTVPEEEEKAGVPQYVLGERFVLELIVKVLLPVVVQLPVEEQGAFHDFFVARFAHVLGSNPPPT